MGNYKWIIGLLFSALFITSCNKEESALNHKNDCTFIQNEETMDGYVDETERKLMTECAENAITSKKEIEENIIGEWKLIGYGDGRGPGVSQPCSYLTISEKELELKYTSGTLDTVLTLPWDIIEAIGGGESLFRLVVESENYVPGLLIYQFCEEYMYGDGAAFDGFTYLYKKVE